MSDPEPSIQQPRRAGLSKSRIALFEQCPKRLWLSVHRPELAEESAAAASSMRAGHEVGAIACALHSDGHMIAADLGMSAAVDETRDLLASGWSKPLFEATFAHEGVLVRVDLMLPEESGWHLAEVKSTTGLKAYHLSDVATQLWVLRENGVRVIRASIRHLDRTFVLTNEGQFDGLFADTNIDDQVEPLVATRSALIDQARGVLAGAEPGRPIGPHCDEPFTCSFKSYCGKHLPPLPEWPTTLLPDTTGKKIAAAYAARGVDDLLAISSDAMTSPKLKRVHAATLSGEIWHDASAIAAETAGWTYPRVFLDFETIQLAVPRWVGTRPFEQVPFQFSAHVQQSSGLVEHRCFLSTDGEDPRRACANALARLPASGAIVAWNASFERGCLRSLASRFPEFAPALSGLADRLVDLLPIVRRHYYHRDMRGSWSLKAVLPTIAPELDYGSLSGVQTGADAQEAYRECVDPRTPPERVSEIREALLKYCELDTRAMLVILERLTAAPLLPSSLRPDQRRPFALTHD